MKDEQEFIRQLLDPRTQQAAYEQLVKNFQRPLYNHIRSMALDHDDTDDILQNTFVKVFRNLHGFKGESKLFSWVYRIATNEAISFLKQKKKRGGLSNLDAQQRVVDNIPTDSWYDGDEIQVKLQKAVALLPEKQQLVFKMRYYQEIPYEELSEILGTSTGALKASYHHAVKKIEDYINKN